MSHILKLSIIVPAYNEANTIHLILDKIKSVELLNNIQKEIIIVNDCSKDNTWEILNTYKNEHPSVNIQLFQHEVNQGKGAALHTGIKKATGDVVVIQDADLEYDPKDYYNLIKPIQDKQYKVVYGSRVLNKNMQPILIVIYLSISN